MTSTAIRMSDFSVVTRIVASVDDQGESCDTCQLVGHVVTATVYGIALEFDEHATYACCADCVPVLVTESMDAERPVVVETLAADDDEESTLTNCPWCMEADCECEAADDDRMHGPDCVCVHPDAL